MVVGSKINRGTASAGRERRRARAAVAAFICRLRSLGRLESGALRWWVQRGEKRGDN